MFSAKEPLAMFDVVPGSEKDAFDAEKRRREVLMQLGIAGLTVFLHGGSDTRRAVREYWQEYARARNIGFECRGNCMCIIGGSA